MERVGELGRCMWLLERVGSVHVVAQEIMLVVDSGSVHTKFVHKVPCACKRSTLQSTERMLNHDG